MHPSINESRRRLLKNLALGAVCAPVALSQLGTAFAADPLVTAADATAQAVKYVDDASKSTSAKPGSHCGNCALYQGAAGSAQGGCGLFPGKQVKATGVCLSWTPKA